MCKWDYIVKTKETVLFKGYLTRNHAYIRLELALRRLAVQRPRPVQSLQCFLFDAAEQLVAGRDVMNQADHLAGSPHLFPVRKLTLLK